MENQNPINELPKELEATLQSLGGVQAPDELWHRVAMSLEGQTEAPDELWRRVAPEVTAIARPVRRFKPRLLASAAAVLILAGISLLPERPVAHLNTTASIDVAAHHAKRDMYAGKVLSREVSPDQLSSISRSFAMMAGANPEPTGGGQ